MKTKNYNKVDNYLSKQYLPVWLTIIIGTLLSGIGFATIKNLESQKISIEFQSLALDRVHQLEYTIKEEIIDVLLSLKSFYQSSQEVNREEFKQFVSYFLDKMPSIQALEWVPYVPANEREKYELKAQKDGYSNFKFTQRNEVGKIIRSRLKAEYFPVYFVEPYQGNEKALGFDLASNLNRLAALKKARDSGEAIATSKIQLVQKTENTDGFLIFQAIYQKQSINNSIADFRKNLQGFVVGVFSIKELFEKSLDEFSTQEDEFDIYIYDSSAST
ncbi:MAG: hypothetical protein F6K40_30360 [Okeania sp. SIO3I5]|uniref:CHASE domain-containing protein n=1 Tax=Okeania sp. SIO3I5 TaxID=2607805 RepID=UPI0013BAEDEC|nr:CHASE domain-containing protein [Okeania sp. SIO3I5]NEQ40309.1 hypothetical protein [Okeania sp. SIO3I5]